MRLQTWHWRDHVYLYGWIVYMTIRGRFGSRTKHNEKVVNRADTRDRALIGVVFIGSLILPVLYLFTPWLRFADYWLPEIVACCGTAIMVGALWLFWRAHVDL